ncbi:MAG: hypothetical protein WBJ33_05395, partial [Candidatus Nanopelagicales bacterium]
MTRTTSLSALLDLTQTDPGIAGIGKLASATVDLVDLVDLVGPAASYPLVIAQLARSGRTQLVLTPTGRAADELARSLAAFIPRESIAVFPSWETLPHERLSPSSDTVGTRMAVLRRLAHPIAGDHFAGPISVVIASVRAALQPIVANLGQSDPVRLEVGGSADLTTTVTQLVDYGYERVDLVERRGQIAVRGGILDVFPPTEEHPLRLEFWGDDIEEIRYFAVSDQRTLEVAPHGLWATPVRELLLTPQVRERAKLLGEAHVEVAAMCESLALGIPVEGMESLSPVLAGDMRPLHALMPESSSLVLCQPERIKSRAADVVK